jgi:ribosomal protein L22
MSDENPNVDDAQKADAEKAATDAAQAKAKTKAASAKPKAKAASAKPKAKKAETKAKAADKTEKADEPKPKKPRAPRKPKAEAAKKTEDPAPVQPQAATRRRSATPASGEIQLVRAHAKYVRSSARKARLVCDQIRGKSVDDARAILSMTARDVARDWSKLLESAVSNAENNHELVGDELRIRAVTADEGPTLKRFQPRAMGRATTIRKRTSHLSITLTPKG